MMDIIQLDYVTINARISQILEVENAVQLKFGKLYDTLAWGEKEFAHPLPKKEVYSLAQTINNRVVGFSIAYEFEPKVCHISRVAVSPVHIGQGLGDQLLKQQLERMKTSGQVGCTIDLTSANERAYRFYNSLGFSKLKEQNLVEYVSQKKREREEYLGVSATHLAMKIHF